MDRVQKNVNLGYTPEDMQAGSALKAQVEALPNHPVMLDLQAAINHLKPFGKVGIFGFCCKFRKINMLLINIFN